MSQAQQIVSSSYPTHVSNSSATFTVVHSSSALHIPVSTTVSTGGTTLQGVPVRFNASQLTAVSSSSGDSLVTQSAQLVSSSGQQIIIPAGSQSTQHMVIPLQTSIKVTSGATSSSAGNTTIVSNFIRKRDADGSPIRAAKNLGPTLLSMSSSGGGGAGGLITGIISSASASPAASSVGSTYSMASITTTGSSPASSSNASVAMSNSVSNLTTEALARKDRAAAAAAAAASISVASSATPMRSTRAESPASSDGSTTVSANSSPGIDQQLQDGSMGVHSRMPGASDATHFNPINDLYANHHSVMSQQQQQQHSSMPGTPASSRNSSLDQQQHHHGSTSSASSNNAQRMNGGPIDCPPRKKSRRSTNDSQLSSHSQASLSLPPPQSINSNNVDASGSQYGNGINYEGTNNVGGGGGGSASTSNNYSNHKNNNNMPAAAGNKENAKPVEYYLKRPRNCTLWANYKQTWKPANNHFMRYTDVKPREERPPSVIDLANQDNVLHKINGWKLYLMATQMQDLCQNETQGYDTLSSLLTEMESHSQNPDMERISDLLKGNMQRNKIIVDGINEAQNQMMKIFDHKTHVSDIIHRCASKRNFKKREKV